MSVRWNFTNAKITGTVDGRQVEIDLPHGGIIAFDAVVGKEQSRFDDFGNLIIDTPQLIGVEVSLWYTADQGDEKPWYSVSMGAPNE